MFKPLNHTVLALIAGATVSTGLLLPATAGQFNDGRTFFDRSPSLTRSATSNPATQFSSTYEFTLSLPPDAGEPLGAVTISQDEAAKLIDFDLSNSVAFASDRDGVESRLSLASIGGDESTDPRETTLVFDPPVQPGTTVTIALEVKRNPTISGTYLFGVTAYPAGENSIGLFLGRGRLTFHDNAR